LNPDFAEGLAPDGVPLAWHAFHGGPGASYRWGPDPFFAPGSEGNGRDVLLISTIARERRAGGQYAGLYQDIAVVPGDEYRLLVRGVLRSPEGEAGSLGGRYLLQWGADPGGGTDAGAVRAWWDMPLRPSGQPFLWEVDYSQVLRAPSDRLTIFVRLLKRDPAPGGWAGLYLEMVSLQGPSPQR